MTRDSVIAVEEGAHRPWRRPWTPEDAVRHLWAKHTRHRGPETGLLDALAPWIGLSVGAALCALIWKLGLPAEDPTDSSHLVGALFVVITAAGLVATHMGLDAALRRVAERRPRGASRGVPIRRVAKLLAAALVGWFLRPLLHGPAMLLYVYPLVTWIPLVGGLVVVAAFVLGAVAAGRGGVAGLRVGLGWHAFATVATWVLFMMLLPAWQGHALYAATPYSDASSLPLTTQPRLLPKAAARDRGGLRDAHLVVEPSSGRLVWSAEVKGGAILRGSSQGVALQPLDRVDGSLTREAGAFSPAVSTVGPGSLTWRAAKRHYFTRVQERVLVPLDGGRAVAVAPYIGYRGFPVRHPYWRGVYVYHQDGTIEDLTPEQAMARPELARSGRLFPERLARRIGEAYGYGPRPRIGKATQIDDPPGNPQPYLTNLGDGQIQWVTIAHPRGDPGTVAAVFLTDAVTGRTSVWHAPPGARLLSNEGATRLAEGLDIDWTSCCDSNGNGYKIRFAAEPRPVFVAGRLFYLVSVLPVRDRLDTPEPVDLTVIVDAQERRIVKVVDHASPEADDVLQAFFARRPASGSGD
ncbi:MAG: hypothetical protein QOE28_548 [Solirubrobacteraceae bacterium]|jgi:hypothetical protein|nr:hypothetical protein [Solirubrobacteraceae bacterium]